MLRFDRKQQNSVKQLFFNKKIKDKKINDSSDLEAVNKHWPKKRKLTNNQDIFFTKAICKPNPLNANLSF